MFTGIVEKRGRVAKAGRRMSVDTGWPDLVLGESVSVSGVCLTVARIDGSHAGFDVVAETMKKTTLGALKPGDRVNLERALRASDRLGGHVVQGHVDGTGLVLQAGATLRVRTALAAQMVPKGSVAVDGVSLTVVDASADEFSIALIPTTLRLTTLGAVKRGSWVNVELDVLLKKRASSLTLDLLRKAGFA
jgi:riboflavin synthase